MTREFSHKLGALFLQHLTRKFKHKKPSITIYHIDIRAFEQFQVEQAAQVQLHTTEQPSYCSSMSEQGHEDILCYCYYEDIITNRISGGRVMQSPLSVCPPVCLFVPTLSSEPTDH